MKTMEEIKKIALCDFKKPKVTKTSIQDVFDYPQLYRGSVRTSIGAIYTDDEYEEFRKNAYTAKLP